jgi:hypothetical protein
MARCASALALTWSKKIINGHSTVVFGLVTVTLVDFIVKLLALIYLFIQVFN